MSFEKVQTARETDSISTPKLDFIEWIILEKYTSFGRRHFEILIRSYWRGSEGVVEEEEKEM